MGYYLLLVISLIILFLILLPLYFHLKHVIHMYTALVIKGLSTFIPILLCISAIIFIKLRSNSPSIPDASYWLLAGLILCLIGDIVLGIQFAYGMGAFLFGHICYITAFCKLAPLKIWSIYLFMILYYILLRLFYPYCYKMAENIVPFITYGTTILIMVSVALIIPFTVGIIGILPALGALLFVISDFMLAKNILTNVTPLSDTVSLYLYYAGQLLLAISVYWFPSY